MLLTLAAQSTSVIRQTVTGSGRPRVNVQGRHKSMLRAEHVKTAPSHVASSRRFCVEAQSAYSPSDVVTGVIIVDHGSRRKESNELVADLAIMFKGRTGYGIVEGAHMELAAPTIADAYDACVKQGATRVVVTPYFLGPGRHWQEDIPALTTAAAAKHPGTEFLVAAPLGLHPLVVEALHARMEHCVAQATAVEGAPNPCDVCGAVPGKGPCTLSRAAPA